MDEMEPSPRYAGVGSRTAPLDVIVLCQRIAQAQRRRGRVLRTGHAIGCDQAFERGACTRAEVYLPWKDYESEVRVQARYSYPLPSMEAMQLVLEHHPAPENLSMASVRLLGRNCHIILGRELDEPVERVVCWTESEQRGGTAFTIRVARAYDIPVDNLLSPVVRRRWIDEYASVLP